MDDEYRFMLNKYIQRFVHSFMCVLFAILGCLLGFSKPREQKFIGMLIAVGLIFAYYITIPFFDLLAEKAVLSPWITSMIAPVVAIVLIVTLKKVKDL
jgi:lipopolysaccharide export LptBFGC system permease protein LptF